MISGAEGWEDIAAFGHSKLEWLRRFIPLKNGVPSHDCIAYVISRLDPKRFTECFIGWAEDVREKTLGEIVAVDGKTARESQNRKRGKNPLHMVSACRAVCPCRARALGDRELPALENGCGAQGGCQPYPQGQRGGYHDNDPSLMPQSVSERVFQTQHQEKMFEGRLG